MNDFELSKNIARPIKGAIIVMLVLAFIVVFIPLWQLGAASSGTAALGAAERTIADNEREGRALRAAIAAGLSAAEEEFTVSASNGYQS
ncbi:MAG: hypothetical protein IAA97_08450 [Spirochaetes bacterium]|uniref:Uncharacterized protein n=1 Tax=Candidatus Ornithospirochaeta stercoripullorum TaxID=2840899 RepID=A0A9D9E1V2_9SPIO|nr:hypothetical protein [Candidatus Ornithospirochaeta stercoripullorum]